MTIISRAANLYFPMHSEPDTKGPVESLNGRSGQTRSDSVGRGGSGNLGNCIFDEISVAENMFLASCRLRALRFPGAFTVGTALMECGHALMSLRLAEGALRRAKENEGEDGDGFLDSLLMERCVFEKKFNFSRKHAVALREINVRIFSGLEVVFPELKSIQNDLLTFI
jgi:hypothetical protein